MPHLVNYCKLLLIDNKLFSRLSYLETIRDILRAHASCFILSLYKRDQTMDQIKALGSMFGGG